MDQVNFDGLVVLVSSGMIYGGCLFRDLVCLARLT